MTNSKLFYSLLLAFSIIAFLPVVNAITYDLNTTTSYDLTIIGNASDNLGAGYILLGDADADGRNDDLVVQAYKADYNGNYDVGGVYVFLDIPSRSGTLDTNAAKVPTDFNVAIFGSAGSDYLGSAGAAFGDVDCDGFLDDIVIQAYLNDDGGADAGAAYVFLNIGQETGIINLAIASGKSKIDLNIVGPNASAYLGRYGVGFGDSDADGCRDDLVVEADGVTYGGNSSAGCDYLINSVGSKLGTIDLTSTSAVNLTVCGSKTNASLGYGPQFFGDVDNDGFLDDLLLTAYQDGPSSATYIIKNAGTKFGTTADTNTQVVDLNIISLVSRDFSSSSYAIFGDSDADGNSDDLFLPAYETDPAGRSNAGVFYLFKDLANESGSIDLRTSAGMAKVDLNIYGGLANDRLGFGGVGFGDLAGNGTRETLAVQAPYADPLGRASAGMVYLISSLSTKSGTIDLNTATVDHNFLGGLAGDNLGVGGIIFDDVDLDGIADDLIISASAANPAGRTDAGQIWLFDLLSNSAPDINVTKIDNYLDNAGLPAFSYFQDGNLTIDFNVMDPDAGNTLTVDLNYSSSNIQGTGAVIADNLVLNATYCNDADFTNSTRCTYDFNISASLISSDGNYYILAFISDGTASDFNASDNNFMVDNTKPVTRMDYNNGWQNNDANITLLSRTDANSGINITQYRIDANSASGVSMGAWQTFDANVLIAADGNWAIDFNSSDKAGNLEDTNRIYILIDKNSPFTNADFNRSWQKTDANVHLTCTDSGSGCLLTRYRLDTDSYSSVSYGAWQTYDANILLTQDGNWAIDFNSSDNVTNREDTNTIYVLIERVAPQMTADYNSNWQNFDANVLLACSDANSGCANKYYRKDTDSSSTVSYGAWTAYDTNIAFSADGNYALDFNAVDNAGNWDDTNTIYVLVDKTAPSVSISAPSNGSSQTSTTVTLEYTGSDANSGIARYWVSSDGTNWIDNNANTTYSFTSQPTGSRTYRVKAIDNADNNSSDANATITISSANNESTSSGSSSRGEVCGNRYCNQYTLENCSSCPTDCGACPVIESKPLTVVDKEIFFLQKDYGSFSKEGLIIASKTEGMRLETKRVATEKEVEITRGLRVFSLVDSNGASKGFLDRVKISVKNTSGIALEFIEVIESIPKEFAQTASQITSDHNFTIIENDPLIKFSIGSLANGETAEIIYDFNKAMQTQQEIEKAFYNAKPPAVLLKVSENDSCFGLICNDFDACTIDSCSNGECFFTPKCSADENCNNNGDCIPVQEKNQSPKKETSTPINNSTITLAAIAIILAILITAGWLLAKRKKPARL